MEATDSKQFDGTIESAVDGLLSPEITEEQTSEQSQETEVEQQVEEPDVEPEVASSEAEESDEDSQEYDEELIPADEAEPQLYTVKVNGREERVTLAELQQGFSGQRHINQGLEALANQRKEQEAAQQDLNARWQEFNAVYEMMKHGIPAAPVMPRTADYEGDPFGLVEAQTKYQEDLAIHNQQVAQVQGAVQGHIQNVQAQNQQILQNELQVLGEYLPEFVKEETRNEKAQWMITNAEKHYGMTPEETRSLVKASHIRIINDALKYRDLQAKKGSAEKAAQPKSSRTVRPGAKKVRTSGEAERKARKQLQQSGRIEDALSLILD